MSEFWKKFVPTLTVGVFLTALAVGASQVPGWIEHVVPIVIVKPPFECEGKHVLVIEDQDNRRNMTSEQIAAIDGAEVRGYLKEHAKQSLFLSEDTKESDLADKWVQDAWKVYKADSKGELPWIVLSNGKQGTSEKYPGTVADALALLKAYGD